MANAIKRVMRGKAGPTAVIHAAVGLLVGAGRGALKRNRSSRIGSGIPLLFPATELNEHLAARALVRHSFDERLQGRVPLAW